MVCTRSGYIIGIRRDIGISIVVSTELIFIESGVNIYGAYRIIVTAC